VVLASSRNPREFIQRRGRVLRKAPEKYRAVIHDAVVRPPSPGDDAFRSLATGEIARALEFADHALNESSGLALRRLAIEWDIDLEEAAGGGFEVDAMQEDG
jgi:hypothetical protein